MIWVPSLASDDSPYMRSLLAERAEQDRLYAENNRRLIALITRESLEGRWGNSPTITTSSVTAICPDLLRLSDLGAADNWRGRVVRGFFRVLQMVTGL